MFKKIGLISLIASYCCAATIVVSEGIEGATIFVGQEKVGYFSKGSQKEINNVKGGDIVVSQMIDLSSFNQLEKGSILVNQKKIFVRDGDKEIVKFPTNLVLDENSYYQPNEFVKAEYEKVVSKYPVLKDKNCAFLVQSTEFQPSGFYCMNNVYNNGGKYRFDKSSISIFKNYNKKDNSIAFDQTGFLQETTDGFKTTPIKVGYLYSKFNDITNVTSDSFTFKNGNKFSNLK